MKVGVLGAGQLGRMLALAGYPLGLQFRFLDPTPEAPASHLAQQVVGDYRDIALLKSFAEGLDVITYEFENVPVETVRLLSSSVAVYPPAAALEVAQDRLAEKTFFQRQGIPTPPFAAVDTEEDLETHAARIGLPAVLKTRRMGYDGKGQMVLRNDEDKARAWQALGAQALILEGFVPFEREVSLLSVRGRKGEIVFYPLVENHHREGILRVSIAPAHLPNPTLQEEAEGYARRILTALDYVGVLAIEFFLQEGRLLANEMAPRVHNSGHWTIEGADTSQFANHLRAVCGLPLGSCHVAQTCAMVNLIGETPPLEALLRLDRVWSHFYGKEPRPGRKVGHVTLFAEANFTLQEKIGQVQSLLLQP